MKENPQIVEKYRNNYRNKYYEMLELKQNKSPEKSKSTNLESKKIENKDANKADDSSSHRKYYKKRSETEQNFFVKSSNQIFNNPIIRNIFSKKRLFGFLGISSYMANANIYARYWKLCDSLMILSNFFIMIFAFFDYEINFSYPRNVTPKSYLFRDLICLFSIFSICCVILRHYYKLKWKNPYVFSSNKNNFYTYSDPTDDEEDDWFINENISFMGNKFKKFFKLGLFIDILVNLLVPNPFFDFIITSIEIDGKANQYVKIEYLYSDIMFVFILIRIVYLIRATINYSIFTDNYANSVSKEYGMSCNIRFALKCILKTHHIKVVILFFITSNIILGFVLRVFERPFLAFKGRLELEYLTNSIWLVFITMLTIGFGDFVPYTFGGRIICMIAGLWGTFICSLVVVCLYGLFDLSNDQFLVFVKIVKGRSAIRFIENAYLYRKAKFIEKVHINEARSYFDSMISSFNEFKNMRNESKSIYRSNGLLFYNMRLLKEMKRALHRFDKLEYDLEAIGNPIHVNTNSNKETRVTNRFFPLLVSDRDKGKKIYRENKDKIKSTIDILRLEEQGKKKD